MKAIAYVRVSSREQAEEGYSIESQQKFLREYALNNGLELVKEFVEVESAKQSGRPAFNEMQAYLRTHSTVRTILCEKTDRLYRNFKDYVALDVDQYGLTVILAKEGETISKDSKSHQKLVHGLKVLLAKNYIDNLKEETGKGLREKAEQGEFPSRAPLGYRNNKETKRIEVNADQAPLIRRLFELYATGEYSLTTVKDKIAEEGLHAKGGRKLHKAEIDFTLHNPIYYGYFRWNETIYKGVHEPIISKELFDRAQSQFKRHNKPKQAKRSFAYSGMMTCGSCGCSITAEMKKGKYIYYHCTQGKGDCDGGSIRQEALEDQFSEIVRRISIDDKRLEWFKKALTESHAQEKDHHNETVAALNREHKQLQHYLDTAYQDRLNGVIDAAHWADASMKWKNRQASIMDALKRLLSANGAYLNTGIRILELSNKAYAMFKVRESHEKRQLLNIVLSNSVLQGNKVTPTYKRPFDILVKGSSDSNWLPESDAPQNGNGLIFEFPFGLLNTIKGEKRILSREFLLEAAYTRIKRPKTWFVKDRLKLAQECLQLLHDCPALTRRELARQLLMTTARFNQILSLHGLAPQIQREIFSLNPVGERRLTERPLLLLLKLDSMAQIKEFRRLFRS